MRELTRKAALLEAIELVKRSDIPRERKEALTEMLALCVEELPFAKWSKAAIYDACDQFYVDRGRVPSIKDFDRAGLPSHTVVKRRLGITVRELREQHFPKELLDGRNRDAVVETFRKEYKRCKASTLKGYDKNRGVGQPCAQTVMKAAGVSRWSDLLDRAGVETVKVKSAGKRESPSTEYNVSASYPWDKLQEAADRKAKEVTA